LQVTEFGNAVELEKSFFDIVDIEEELHFARRVAELRDIRFKVFLDLRSEIAQAQTTHLVVPFDDRSLILLRYVFSNPAINLFIARAGRNELLELHCVQAGELPKVSA
jgi:hypothetical protein